MAAPSSPDDPGFMLPNYHLIFWEVLELSAALRHEHGVGSIVESLGVAEGAAEAYHTQMAAVSSYLETAAPSPVTPPPWDSD